MLFGKINEVQLINIFLLISVFSIALYSPSAQSVEKNSFMPSLVLLPIGMSENESDYKSEYGAALQEGLQERYTVYYGHEVEKQLEKEYARVDCDEETCAQNVAIAFNGELIADASVKKIENGYLLKLIIRNVLTNKIIETQTDPCEECNYFSVMTRLRAMGSGRNSILLTSKNRMDANAIQTNQGGKAILIVDSIPSGARVSINGKASGVTPYQGLNHRVGDSFLVDIMHPFYKLYSMELEIEQAITHLQPIKLERGHGKVLITVEPFRSNTIIHINGKAKGNAPLQLTLSTGDYTLKALHKSGESHDFKLRLVDGDNRMIPLSFSPPKNKLGMEFVHIPAGHYQMGGSEDITKPVHRVDLATFSMMTTEVTQGQWEALMGSNPSKFKVCGKTCPVDSVSFNEIQDFIRRLNLIDNKKYRLPSESEWEYAARAGSSSNYSWGDKIHCSQANYGQRSNSCSNENTTVPVKSYWPNDFGLYDMHGNLREWTQDCWHDSYIRAPSDGTAWEEGECSFRVLRGGSWYSLPKALYSDYRTKTNPNYKYSTNGFRLVMD